MKVSDARSFKGDYAGTALSRDQSEDESDDDEGGMVVQLFPFLAKAEDKFFVTAGTALRVSVWCTIYASLIMMVGRQNLSSSGFDGASILCNVLFTVGADLGSTISNVFYGVIGTFWSWFVFWLFVGIFPNGYDGTNPEVWWLGVFVIVVYTFGFLVLNVNGNVRFWALLNFTGGYAMDLLNPSTLTSGYSTGFTFNEKGKVENAAVLFLVGALLSFIIFLLPIYTSLSKMQTRTTQVLEMFEKMTERVFGYYNGSYPTLEINHLMGELEMLKFKLSRAQAHGGNSWFESLGKSRKRAMTNKVVSIAGDIIAVFEELVRCCEEEDFTQSHQAMMRYLAEPLQAVLVDIQKLLKISVDACEDGQLDGKEKATLQACLQHIPQKVARVQEKIQEASRQFGSEPVLRSVLGEHAFAYLICKAAQDAVDGAKELENSSVEDNLGEQFRDTVKNMFKLSTDDWKWSVRMFVAILLNFTLGYHGICDQISMDAYAARLNSPDPAVKMALVGTSMPVCFVNKYTAGLANINVVLLSKLSGGATLKAGVDRVSAVVLASVVGQIGYVLLGYCTDIYKLFTVIAVFFVCVGFMYMNYQGGPAAAIGQRLAAMTVYSLMVPCSNEAYTYAVYSGSYHSLVEIVLGTIIMTVCDIILGDKSASAIAKESQTEAIDELNETFQRYFDNDISPDDLKASFASISGKLSEAADASAGAVFEPNYWRPEWKPVLFDTVNREYVKVTTYFKDAAMMVGGDKEELLDRLANLRSVRNELVNAMGFTGDVAKASINGNVGEVQELMRAKNRKGNTGDHLTNTVMSDMNRQFGKLNLKEKHAGDVKMHINSASRQCVMVLTLQKIWKSLQEIQETAVKTKMA